VDLILKPTAACNFKCTFCSSTHDSIQGEEQNVDVAKVEQFLTRYPNTNTVIINGGDPLMMKPAYYWQILEVMERLAPKAILSFTSNLWAFYKKPEMWEELFRHPKVGVCTSFQYGNKRLKGDLTPFTEEEFWKISDMMLERVGYRPPFIAVIDSDNEHTVMDTVLLAKKMGVVCKINPALSSGKPMYFKGIKIGNAGKMFTTADIYQHYVTIYKAGLAEWEHNTKQMTDRLRGVSTTCPLESNCDAHIRALQPNGYFSCGAFGDDNSHPIDFEVEMAGGFVRPLINDPHLFNLKNACFECPMFQICNGCKKTVSDMKELGLVESHCQKMKTLAQDIINANEMAHVFKVTPYVSEAGDA
jgi:sulfatase maturation enzyme AslB (radical SAM superfamily)